MVILQFIRSGIKISGMFKIVKSSVKSLLRKYLAPLLPKLYGYYSLYVHWKNGRVLVIDFDLLNNTVNRKDADFLPLNDLIPPPLELLKPERCRFSSV